MKIDLCMFSASICSTWHIKWSASNSNLFALCFVFTTKNSLDRPDTDITIHFPWQPLLPEIDKNDRDICYVVSCFLKTVHKHISLHCRGEDSYSKEFLCMSLVLHSYKPWHIVFVRKTSSPKNNLLLSFM